MKVRLVVLGCVTAACTFAQFDSLSCTRDGSTLFFVSRLQQAGMDQPGYGKIFVADQDGVRLFAYRDREWYPIPAGFGGTVPAGTTNFYDISGVSFAGNETGLAVGALRECVGLSAGQCGFADRFDFYDVNGTSVLSGDGHLKISASGKWGLLIRRRLSGSDTEYMIVGLETSNRSINPGGPSGILVRDWSQHDIADNGVATLAALGEVIIARPGTQQRLERPSSENRNQVETVRIDARGTLMVWAEDNKIHTANLTDLKPIRLSRDGFDDFAPQLSEDGSRILFLSTVTGADDSQIYVMKSDGSDRRKVTAEPEGIQKAILSGDGKVAWAVTWLGRLLKIDLEAMASRQMTGPVLTFLNNRLIGNDGSVFVRAGMVVTAGATVVPNQPVAMEIDGVDVPVVRVARGVITLQIPAQLAPGTYALRFRPPAEGGWIGMPVTVRVVAVP